MLIGGAVQGLLPMTAIDQDEGVILRHLVDATDIVGADGEAPPTAATLRVIARTLQITGDAIIDIRDLQAEDMGKITTGGIETATIEAEGDPFELLLFESDTLIFNFNFNTLF